MAGELETQRLIDIGRKSVAYIGATSFGPTSDCEQACRAVLALEAQREDITLHLEELRNACARLEEFLAKNRPDLLPQAADYDSVLRARLDDVHEVAAK